MKLMVAMPFPFAGAPCTYCGDEIGLEGENDPDCRRCCPWGWEQRAEERTERSEPLAYYKRLIALRKANPAQRRGGCHLLTADPERQLYAFGRRVPDNRCIVAPSRSGHDQVFRLSPAVPATELPGNHPVARERVTVPARQAIIVRLGDPGGGIGRAAAVPGVRHGPGEREQHVL
jgi:glycosidase